ncbi:Transthyretin [Folsomia candida]|uniref:Transthyretin n=1 Tax=Folsomia candida TaxID=158441 RepID=A0A226DWC1_FOLCA|nr:Transthyretin [Folsomia candida]
MVSRQIILFSVVTILLYFLAGVIFLVPVISLNFHQLAEINYTCDWNAKVEEEIKASPDVGTAIKIWANKTGYFDSKKFSKNQTLDYNELMNYWDSLPKIEIDGVPELIFSLKVDCFSNDSVVQFVSETILKFPTMRRMYIDILLTNGYSFWRLKLQNFCFNLTHSIYLLCSLAGFVCLCVTCGGIDTELFCLLNFVGLEMLLISGEIIQEIIYQDVFPEAMKRIAESSKLQVFLYSTICIILPAGYFSLIYFLPTDLRSYQCQAGLEGYSLVREAWVSLVHKNGALLVSFGVTLVSSCFGSKIFLEKGASRWSLEFKLLLLVYGISAWLQILEILLYLVIDKNSAIEICRICNFKSILILFLLVRDERTKDGASEAMKVYQERLVELTGEFKTRVSSEGSTFSLRMGRWGASNELQTGQ